MLLKLARDTITQYLTSEVVAANRELDFGLDRCQGAFVTLRKNRELRGCIGHLPDDFPLSETVSKMAFQAAFGDWRFQPVALDELDEIMIEISVLTPYQPVRDYREIVLGRDGIMLKKNGHTAVFLPKVAIDQKWTLKQTLDQLCRKAGLPAGSWRGNAQLFVFQTEEFSEENYR